MFVLRFGFAAGQPPHLASVNLKIRSLVELGDLVSEPAVVLALAERVCPSLNGASSFRLASALEAIDTGSDLSDTVETEAIVEVLRGLDPARVEHWQNELDSLDAQLVTVLDDDYPTNLRMVHDHPPFLFIQGSVYESDDRAIAVVGTRRPSEDGIRTARQLSSELAERQVTVVSGMAEGIDAAAHAGALSAGGRTLAVMGTGIGRVYPASNRRLAVEISRSGALLSQFWPGMAPTRWTFPVRNIVTSGLALGTVVVEAGPTSGARQQAEHALRHGKRLFLLRRLVEHQPWAQEMLGASGVVAIDDLNEILAAIELELGDPRADVLV